MINLLSALAFTEVSAEEGFGSFKSIKLPTKKIEVDVGSNKGKGSLNKTTVAAVNKTSSCKSGLCPDGFEHLKLTAEVTVTPECKHKLPPKPVVKRIRRKIYGGNWYAAHLHRIAWKHKVTTVYKELKKSYTLRRVLHVLKSAKVSKHT